MPRRRRRLRIFAPGTRLDKFGRARFLRFRSSPDRTHRRRACRAQYGSGCTDAPSCDIITAMGDLVAAARAARAGLLKLVAHPSSSLQHPDPVGRAEDGRPHRLARSARTVLPFGAYPQPHAFLRANLTVHPPQLAHGSLVRVRQAPATPSIPGTNYTFLGCFTCVYPPSAVVARAAQRRIPTTVIKAPGLWATPTSSTRPA